jgi:hypothetical protein
MAKSKRVSHVVWGIKQVERKCLDISTLANRRGLRRVKLFLTMTADPNPRRTVSQKHVLYSEILSVTSAMRKNSRWASATHFMVARDSALGSDLGLRVSNSSQAARRVSREADLMLGFEELKRAVRDIEGWSDMLMAGNWHINRVN